MSFRFPSPAAAAVVMTLVGASTPACAPRNEVVQAGAGASATASIAKGDWSWPTYTDALPAVPFSMDTLQRRTFNYFWELSDAHYQIPDRWPTERFSSIAATGFGLPALAVGIERGYVTRTQGAERARKTLEALWVLPQGEASSGTVGYRGLFYHFLEHDTGTRYQNSELSTIDTGLLMAGVLAAGQYFDGDTDDERAIRELSEKLYRRVEWDYAWMDDGSMTMGWRPDKGFIPARWKGYNEASILLLLAMGSPTHPIPDTAWAAWTRTYDWGGGYGARDHAQFDPLFGHQYSQLFLDFRGIQDDYMSARGIDYFENSVRASELQHGYAKANPFGFAGLSEQTWGLTACDGPGRFGVSLPPGRTADDLPPNEALGRERDSVRTRSYWARGVDGTKIKDDGTVSPTAAGGSWPFTPAESEAALAAMWDDYQPWLVGRYGLRDAFNLNIPARGDQPGAPGWFNDDYLGIDQGPILLQIENHRTGLIWDLLKTSPHVVRGLRRAGFRGGWLDEAGSTDDLRSRTLQQRSK